MFDGNISKGRKIQDNSKIKPYLAQRLLKSERLTKALIQGKSSPGKWKSQFKCYIKQECAQWVGRIEE